jgi:hypothetical protein
MQEISMQMAFKASKSPNTGQPPQRGPNIAFQMKLV